MHETAVNATRSIKTKFPAHTTGRRRTRGSIRFGSARQLPFQQTTPGQIGQVRNFPATVELLLDRIRLAVLREVLGRA